MTGFALALTAGYGIFLVFTAVVMGWRGLGVGPALRPRQPRRWMAQRLAQAGLSDVSPLDLAAVMAALAVVGAGVAFALFGGAVAPALASVAAASVPVTGARSQRTRRRSRAREAWPRMLEEVRLQAVTMGRSVPQALFVVGLRGPAELRGAFRAAQREWLLSTDFARTLAVLKGRLADPTADAVCETLLIAHEVGGSDLDRRLTALTDDRIQDLQGRKDARAKQAGARFARWFVVVVPVGMALAGLSIGEGRRAYGTPAGQIAVLVGLLIMGGCWAWAGRIMRLPTEDRVFSR